MNKDNVSGEEMLEIFEAMAAIQTLPQWERVALQFYIKGIIAAMSGQLPVVERRPPTPTAVQGL